MAVIADADIDSLNAQIDELYMEGRLKEVEAVLKEMMELIKSEDGEQMAYVNMLNRMGGYYREMHEFEKAESVFLEAMKICAEISGRDHPDYATTINNFASLCRIMKKFAKSEKLFLEAMKIYEKTLGKQHFLYSSALNNLGLLYQDMGEFEKAAKLHEEALEIVRKQEEDKIIHATSLNNLASAYRALGRNVKTTGNKDPLTKCQSVKMIPILGSTTL